MSLRDRIRKNKDLKTGSVEVPEWTDEGEPLVVIETRTISGTARAEMFANFTDEDGEFDLKYMYPALVIAGSFDPENGEKVFDVEDADWLGGKSAGALDRVAQSIMTVSGMDTKAVEQAGKDLSSKAATAMSENDSGTTESPSS